MPTWIKTTMLITVRFIWYMLLGLVLFAFVQFRNRMKDVWWLLSLCMVVTIAYCSVHGIPRYALPLHPFYFILAIASAFSIWDTIGHRCTKTVRMTPKLT